MNDALLNDLTCPITLDLLEDPISLPCCGKAASRAAVITTFRVVKRCPMCNADLSEFHPAAAARNVVLAGLVETLKNHQQQQDKNGGRPGKARQHKWKAQLSPVVNEKGETLPVAELKLSLKQAKFVPQPSLFIAVVDRSGSMSGAPWRQVETALLHIMGLSRTNSLVKTMVVAYDSNAAIINVDGSESDVTRTIKTMFTGGGTNFRAAFQSIRDVLVQQFGSDDEPEDHDEDCKKNSDDQKQAPPPPPPKRKKPQFSSVTVAFLTDGQAELHGTREQLVSYFHELLEDSFLSVPSCAGIPLLVHAVGFGGGCDKELLECLRKSGTAPGTFRFAEPTDEPDALCGKLTGLFDLVASSTCAPIQVALPGGMRYLTGEERKDLHFLLNDQLDGELSCWVRLLPSAELPPALGDVSITSEFDDHFAVPVAQHQKPLLNRWLSSLLDEFASEFFDLTKRKQSLHPRVLQLHCALLTQRLQAMGCSTLDKALTERIDFLTEQLTAFEAGGTVNEGKLAAARFCSLFAPAPVSSSSNGAKSGDNVIIVAAPALTDKPTYEHSVRYLQRNTPEQNRNALQQAIINNPFDRCPEVLLQLIQGADVETVMHKDHNGNNALHLAAYCGQSETVKALLAHVAVDLEAQNDDEESAATLAIKKRGFVKTLGLLLSAGACVPDHRRKRLEAYAIAKDFHLTAEIIRNASGAGGVVTVDTSMTADYVTFAYNKAKKSQAAIDADAFFGVAISKCMTPLVRTIMEEHKVQPTIEQFMDHALPKKPDAPDTDQYIELAQLLLKSSSDLLHTAVEGSGDFPLLRAAEKGSLPHVTLFLDLGAQVDQVNHLGNTALWIACAKGYPCIITELLDRGANVNHVNDKGNTPLYGVCQRGPKKVADILLSRGATVDQLNANGDSLVLLCCRNGQPELLELLLNYVSAEFVDHKAHIDGFNALFASTEQNRPGCIEVLAKYGVNLNQKTSEDNEILPGATPLHLAAYYARLDAAQTLVTLGAQIDIQDTQGRTPLHIAVIRGALPIVKLLRSWGANQSIRDSAGNVPLAYCRNRQDIRRLIMDPALECLMGLAKGEFGNEEKNACEVLTRYAGSLGILSAAAAVNIADHAGFSPLSVAIIHVNYHVVQTLLSLGADPKLRNARGNAPMVFALTGQNRRICDLVAPYADQGLQVECKAQMERMARASKEYPGLLFLGAPPKVQGDNSSSIRHRMEGSLAVVAHPIGVRHSVADVNKRLTEDTKHKFTVTLFDSKDFQELSRTSCVWDAQVFTVDVVAAGESTLSPAETMALALYTNNPLVPGVLSRMLSSIDHVALPMQIQGYLNTLTEALYRLPPFEGELFLGANAVARHMFPLGSEVCSATFLSGSTLWMVATEHVPTFAERKKGTVFIVQSKTGRFVGNQSPFSFDAEVMFAPRTRFRVANYYHGDVICLGQKNIRQHTFKVKPEELSALLQSEKPMIIELEEVSDNAS